MSVLSLEVDSLFPAIMSVVYAIFTANSYCDRGHRMRKIVQLNETISPKDSVTLLGVLVHKHRVTVYSLTRTTVDVSLSDYCLLRLECVDRQETYEE